MDNGRQQLSMFGEGKYRGPTSKGGLNHFQQVVLTCYVNLYNDLPADRMMECWWILRDFCTEVQKVCEKPSFSTEDEQREFDRSVGHTVFYLRKNGYLGPRTKTKKDGGKAGK